VNQFASLSVREAVPGACFECGSGDEDSDDWCAAAEQLGAVGVGAVAEQLGEGVGGQLFGVAAIAENSVCRSGIIIVDEPWSATSGEVARS
jgi:hypothetical protein